MAHQSFANIFSVLNNYLFETSALVALSEKRKEIVVAYRATENLMNILLDVTFINATPDEDSPIRIHKGFYIALMSLYADVSNKHYNLFNFRLKT